MKYLKWIGGVFIRVVSFWFVLAVAYAGILLVQVYQSGTEWSYVWNAHKVENYINLDQKIIDKCKEFYEEGYNCAVDVDIEFSKGEVR